MAYGATKSRVSTIGVPPDSFLDELVAWGATAADDIFTPNPNRDDVYAFVVGSLGPYAGLKHRRAVMLEVMRVLAGFESSWRWNQGSDAAADRRAGGVRPADQQEAGAWQVSANSMNLAPQLRNLVGDRLWGSLSATDFQWLMKNDHQAAMEYIARLLRVTVRANGPVVRHEIDAWLSRDAVEEFQSLLYPLPLPNYRGMREDGMDPALRDSVGLPVRARPL